MVYADRPTSWLNLQPKEIMREGMPGVGLIKDYETVLDKNFVNKSVESQFLLYFSTI